MSSTIGKIFSVTTFGESHGLSVGAVVDGCPAGIVLSEKDVQKQLDRRRPGQSDLSSTRNEADRVRICSGVERDITLGSPVMMTVDNNDPRPGDYSGMSNVPRPSHADFTYKSKYGVVASSGGGRSSARETVGRVAAGVVAEKFLSDRFGIEIVAWVSSVYDIDAPDLTTQSVSRDDVDASEIRCPDAAASKKMIDAVKLVAKDGDSVGGIITCVCRGVPCGLGEPVFDKMGAVLSASVMSIPAVKGFEIGSGFSGTRMRGSEHNDMFIIKGGVLGTASNRSGGMQGGITNGEPIVFRVAFKPTASIAATQETVDYNGSPVKLKIKGRHDPCVLPRAVPVVEAMASIVIADMSLIAGL